ncbi:MAG: hypothetical protein PWP23_211 [Candidatus Sumerlaeota bacterium]|nr:hypothetical protein [Candidatus Sumerlaeota bacterium]
MKLLVLTTEPVPLPGLPATGAGLRAWGLTFGLRAAGYADTVLAFAADSVRGRDLPPSPVPGVMTFERSRLKEFIAEQQPDAVILQHWGLGKWLPELTCPLAIDLAGPHLLERRLWGSTNPEEDLREKVQTLARADYVVCSGEFQRHYFLPFLFQAGFDAADHLCPVIPFSVSPDIPTRPHAERNAADFLYAGFFLPWQDPAKTLEWTLETLAKRDKGRLVVVGGPHPGGDVSGGKYDALLEMLDEHERVERRGPMAFDEYLVSTLLQCGVAVDLLPRNPERELAFPTRTVVYMWAGLPVIHNDYDELAEPIRRAKAGWTLDPGDKRGLQRTIERLAGHSEDVERRSQNAQDLVRARYTWDKTIEPLARWCENPAPRRNKRAPIVSVPARGRSAEGSGTPPAGKGRKARVTYSPPPPVTGPNRLQQVLSPLALLIAMPIGLALLLLFGFAELARIILKRR